MPQIVALELLDLTTTGPNPFSSNASRNSSAISSGSTITINSNAVFTTIDITDNDAVLNDGDASQDVTYGGTFNGTTWLAGDEIEIEYSYVIRPVGSTDPADNITIYVLEMEGDVQGIVSDRPLVRGQTYRIQAGGTDDPNMPYNTLHICFTPGAAIATPQGERPVEAIRPGDLVLTMDDGPARVVWASGQTVCGVGRGAPIRFAPGVIGNARPLLLSPQHRVLVGRRGAEALVPAKALLGQAGVTRAPRPMVRYVHLLLEGHQVLFAEGAPVESLLPGPVALRHLPSRLRAEVTALFPDLRPGRPGRGWVPARPLLRPGQFARAWR